MKKILRALVTVGVISTCSASEAKTLEEAAVDQYDRYCIQGVLDHKHLLDTLRNSNAKPVPSIAAVQYLHQAGQVWIVQGELAFLWVFLTNTGACGVKVVGVVT